MSGEPKILAARGHFWWPSAGTFRVRPSAIPNGRGHRFVRYADDIRIFVNSKRAAARVLDQATKVLERDLRLRVNGQKSVIGSANVATLLGFGVYFTARGVKIRVAAKAWKSMKQRIRVLTSRRWGLDRIFSCGGYAAASDTP